MFPKHFNIARSHTCLFYQNGQYIMFTTHILLLNISTNKSTVYPCRLDAYSIYPMPSFIKKETCEMSTI